MNDFERRNREKIADLGKDSTLRNSSIQWIVDSARHEYSYHFSWLGRPIIQYPQDMIAIQEIIWKVKPKVIVETGIAHGGSLIFSASILELLGNDGRVLGVDIDIRPHNKTAISEHPLARRITMIEGSSVDAGIVQQVADFVGKDAPVLVILDSNHTHEHVLRELQSYSPLVQKDSYLIVLDTIIEDMPEGSFPHRTWGPGNSPKSAVHEFLRSNNRFIIDEEYDSKLLITVGPQGYLRCIANS